MKSMNDLFSIVEFSVFIERFASSDSASLESYSSLWGLLSWLKSNELYFSILTDTLARECFFVKAWRGTWKIQQHIVWRTIRIIMIAIFSQVPGLFIWQKI